MIDAVREVLLQHDHFVITTHTRPDGDALGSQVALGLFLRKLGKHVAMINSDPAPSNLTWLHGAEDVETYRHTTRQLKTIAGAEVVIVVDTNALHRLGKIGEAIKNSSAHKLLIDHHTQPETWFDTAFVDDMASSTGELVYDLISRHAPNLIDAPIATALYAAILTDTGSFRYSSVTPKVHRIVADLMERGDLKPEDLYTHLYETKSIHSLRLLGRALETIRLLHGGVLGHITVTVAMLQETGATSEDTEGLVSYVQALEGVKVALIFTEVSNGTKVSFRSKGDWHVNEWARALGGGGHRNASGAFLELPLREAMQKTLDKAPQFLPLSDGVSDGDTLSDADQAYLALMQGRRRHE